MFLYIKGLEIYFYYNEILDNYDIQVKGINDDKLYLHEDYLSIICDILRMVQGDNIKGAIEYLMQFGRQYCAGELPMSYYRELNSNSMYRVLNGRYGLLDIDESYKSILDTSYNYQFNCELFGILTEMMFTR